MVFVLSRPAIMIALAAALAFEMTTLPIDPARDGGESVIGRLIARSIFGKNQVVFAGAREIAVFLARSEHSPTGFEVIDPDAESMDRAARMLRENSNQIAPVGVLARPVARGLWRPTRVDYAWTFRPPRNWTDDDVSRAMLTLAGYLQTQGEPELVALARAITDRRLVRVRWIGYAHNTLDAAILVAFMVSSTWILPGSGWRVRRALGRERCPSCGYSLASLEPTEADEDRTRCPECGRSWALSSDPPETGPRAREQCREKA